MTITAVEANRRFDAMLVLATIVGAVLAALEPRLAIVAIMSVAAVVVWRWPRPVIGLTAVVVLAVRPTLDLFSERRLGLGPLNSSPTVVFGLCVLFVATVVAVRRARNGQTLWPDPALRRAHAWLAVAYCIALVAGAALHGGYGLAVGARESVRMMSVVGGFMVVLWWLERPVRGLSSGWVFLILGALVPIGVALWQLVSGRGNVDVAGINRLQGTFSHPNTFGPFLVPFILLALSGLRNSSAQGQMWRIAVAGMLSVLVALTYSRTAILTLVVALLALPMLQALRFGARALIRSAVLVTVFGAIAWALVGDLVRDRFTGLRVDTEALDAVRSGDVENSLEWRFVTWAVLIGVGAEQPAFGHGAGMTTELNPIVNAESGLPYNAHDDFVRIFFEAGALGLFAYLVYGFLLCRWSLSTARRAPPRRAPSAYAVAAALVSLFFLTGGVPEFGTQTALQYELYGMLALTTASLERSEELPTQASGLEGNP